MLPSQGGELDLRRETLEEIAVTAGFDAQDKLLRGELALALETAMAALPPEQRDVVRSTFGELPCASAVQDDEDGAGVDRIGVKRAFNPK
jgi:hypothetical protein